MKGGEGDEGGADSYPLGKRALGREGGKEGEASVWVRVFDRKRGRVKTLVRKGVFSVDLELHMENLLCNHHHLFGSLLS